MCTTGRTGGAGLPKTVIAQVITSRTLDARCGTLGSGTGIWSRFGLVRPAVVVILDSSAY